MVDVILACSKDFGIGLRNRLPWKCPEELAIFKKKTWGQVVIMGRKTMTALPGLDNRIFLCLSKKAQSPKGRTEKNEFLIFSELSLAFHYAKSNYPTKKIFIAGGAEIYNQTLSERKYLSNISTLHISIFNENYNCDKFIKFPFERWYIVSKEEYEDFTHYEMKYNEFGEHQYLSLLQETYSNGSMRAGRNGITFSQFAKNLTFDLTRGFPLLTGKKMFFRGIAEELLFFLRGETDTDILANKRVGIWEKNTSREFLDQRDLDYKPGLMGPMYGYQWRFFGQMYDGLTGDPIAKGDVDQLKNAIDLIRNDPASRRILMTTYNPAQAEQGVLYPCHSLAIQFYVEVDETTGRSKNLSMYCFNRSSDLFLGLPFNIASSALLLSIIAKCTDLEPKYLHITLGDAHTYSAHREAIAAYVEKTPHFAFPELSILKEISSAGDIEKLKYEDFELRNYQSYASIRAEMIA